MGQPVAPVVSTDVSESSSCNGDPDIAELEGVSVSACDTENSGLNDVSCLSGGVAEIDCGSQLGPDTFFDAQSGPDPVEIWGEDTNECSACSFSHAEDELACTPGPAISVPPLATPVEVSDFLPESTTDVLEIPSFVPGGGTAVVNRAGTSLYVSGTLSSPSDCSVAVSNILVDTGAAVTLVALDIIERLGVSSSLAPSSTIGVSSLVSAGGQPLDLRGTTVLTFALGPIQFSSPVLVVSGLAEVCLLGADVLHGQSISIDLGTEPSLVRGGDRVPLNGFGSPVSRCGSAGDREVSRRDVASRFFFLGGILLVGLIEVLTFCSSCCHVLRTVHVFRLVLVFLFVFIFACRCFCTARPPKCFLPSGGALGSRPPSKPPDSLPVYLVHDISIPAWSQVVVHATVAQPQNTVGMIEHLMSDSSYHVPHSLVTVSAESVVPVLMSNFSVCVCCLSSLVPRWHNLQP